MHFFVQILITVSPREHMFENHEKWIFCFGIREIENLLSWLRDKTPLAPLFEAAVFKVKHTFCELGG